MECNTIKTASFARRLDSIWGDGKCRVSDPSITDSHDDTSLDNQQDSEGPGIQLLLGPTPADELTADIVHADFAPSVEVTAGASAPLFLAETAEQVTADGEEAGPNGRGEDASDEGHWVGLLILEVPLDDGPLQPASPLDPGLLAFIDAVLLGSEVPLAESALPPADEPQNSELLNRSAGSWTATSAAASGLDGRASSSTVQEELAEPSWVPRTSRRNRRQKTIDNQKPSPRPSTPQNVPSGSAADAAGGSGLDGSRPSSNVRENPSKRRPVPIILRRGRKRRIGDEQEPSPDPSTPQNISDGSAEVALGASGPGGRAPSNTVDEGPSVPSPTAKRPRGRRKQRFSVRQEPDPGPPTPQIMPRDSFANRVSWIASAGTRAGGGVSFQQYDPTAVISSSDDPSTVPQLLLPARIMETAAVLLPENGGFFPNAEVLNQVLWEVPSVDPSASPHSSSPGDTSA
ncbi:hypothetical protein EAH_00066390 [Eimeria acervulina]|uniref:Uncharacterized protein n=1 Tax=Eimeria acervulina TaxID=5801 RepID=U6GC76_EIMAC|nr:hypothetical protein EAH_00066390 [Eimeria acervulina]CDI77876.1 hypothetical protein EAH_00066390 [Eimeria acervulina]